MIVDTLRYPQRYKIIKFQNVIVLSGLIVITVSVFSNIFENNDITLTNFIDSSLTVLLINILNKIIAKPFTSVFCVAVLIDRVYN